MIRIIYLVVSLAIPGPEEPIVSTHTSVQDACRQVYVVKTARPEYYVQLYELTPRYGNEKGLFGWEQRKLVCKAKAPQEMVWEADYQEAK